jgi:hypothetical protein
VHQQCGFVDPAHNIIAQLLFCLGRLQTTAFAFLYLLEAINVLPCLPQLSLGPSLRNFKKTSVLFSLQTESL